MTFPLFFSEDCFQAESEAELAAKVESLLRAMTAEEKAELCHGHPDPAVPGKVGNGGYLPGIPRLGVPEIRMYDGPAGVTSVYETTGLPCEELLASTWSRETAYAFGAVTGGENRMISGNCQLGAEVDLVRTTHFNRTRDMLGEDPYLAGELAVPLVKGIQDQHVMAILKHFAGYVVSSNPADAPDVRIDERTMHELYLAPFEKAIAEGNAAGVMTAYSRINGPYAANSEALLKDVLREQWHFDGLTMCDWGGNHSFTLPKGMDMEMPLGAYNSTERILKFLDAGKLTEQALDDAARHVLRAMGKAGYLSLVTLDENGNAAAEEGRTAPIRLPDTYSQCGAQREKHAETAIEIAQRGIVLLKNEDAALPLRTEDFSGDGVAVIGLEARCAICGYGQERAYGTLRRMKCCGTQLERLSGQKAVRELGIDYIGETIPAGMLSTDEEGLCRGLTRYYGINSQDGYRPAPMSMGGEGQEFIGVAAADQDEESEGSLDFAPAELFMPSNDQFDMDGGETGTVFGVDPVVEFTCGPAADGWKNAEGGAAFPKDSAFTWKGYLYAPEDGEYQLNLHAIGGIAVLKLAVNGTDYEDMGAVRLREGTQWPWGNLVCTPEGMEVCAVRVRLEGGRRYPVLLYARAMLEQKDLQIRLAWVTPSERKRKFRQAVEAAARAKRVILTVHDGFRVDRGSFRGGMSFADGTDLELDQEQRELLSAVADAVHANAGKLIVAAYNGSAFAMKSWIAQADAVLWMWMPGQGGGTALARLLLGQACPSGKLPQSFPAESAHTPVTDTQEHLEQRYTGICAPGKPRSIIASERGFTGYRWHDRMGIPALFPFGYGLSYTQFRYEHLQIGEENGSRVAEFDLTNAGGVTGDEIAQVYVSNIGNSEEGLPVKSLCGFARVDGLRPGETRHIRIPLAERWGMYWDPGAEWRQDAAGRKHRWRNAAGPWKLLVGASSEDIRLEGILDG